MTKKTMKKLIANKPQDHLNMSKSKLKKKQSKNKKPVSNPKSKSSVIAIIPAVVNVKNEQDETDNKNFHVAINIDEPAEQKETKLKREKKKRTILWRKFPAESQAAPKVQKIKPTADYQRGIRYSDVLFSAGPCCPVKIKTINEPSLEVPSVELVDNIPWPDQQNVFEIPIVLCLKKVQSASLLKISETDLIKEKKKTLPANLTAANEKKKEFLFNNFVTDLPLKLNWKNKFVDAPPSSDENANEFEDQFDIVDVERLPEISNDLLQITSTPILTPKKDSLTIEEVIELNDHLLPTHWHRIPRKQEKPAHTFFGIPWWNFIHPDLGPDIFPRYSRNFIDQNYLYAEDVANLAFRLSQGK